MKTSTPLFIALSLALTLAAAQARKPEPVGVSMKLVRPVAAVPAARSLAPAPKPAAVQPAVDTEREIWRHHGVG